MDTQQALLTRAKASAYLLERHGIEMSPRTIKNRNVAGRGPFPVYLDRRPLYRPPNIDRWVEEQLRPHPLLKTDGAGV